MFLLDEPVTVRANKIKIGGREWVEIRVTDNGPIVDRTDFFEAPTHAKRKDLGGRGLGLYCLAIRVSLLKGTYGADDRKDGKTGTVIWFRIPFHDNKRNIGKSTASANGANLSNKNNAANISAKNNNNNNNNIETKPPEIVIDESGFIEKPLRTALIVDDSIPILKMSALVLEKVGCAVDKAKNGSIGLEKMKETVYDLVVMDVQMPVMTGIDCIKRLVHLAPLVFHFF